MVSGIINIHVIHWQEWQWSEGGAEGGGRGRKRFCGLVENGTFE